MLLFLTLFSVTYLLSSIHLEIVVLLWFLASCLLLSSPRISEGFLVVNWGGPVFPHHLPKLWVPRPEKLFRPDALLLTMLSPIAWFCWACTALQAENEEMRKSVASFQTCFHPFLVPGIARTANNIYKGWWAQVARCPDDWPSVV